MVKKDYNYNIEVDANKIPTKRSGNMKLEVKYEDFFDYRISFEIDDRKTVFSGDGVPDYLLEWIIGEVVNRLFEYRLKSIKVEGDLLDSKKFV